MKIKLFLLILCGIFFLAGTGLLCQAEDTRKGYFDKDVFINAAKEKRVVRLSLNECLVSALKNNSEILVKEIEPQLRGDDVKIANAFFEPSLTADFSAAGNTEESNSTVGPSVTKTQDINFNAALSGRLVSGTDYRLDFFNNRSDSNALLQRFDPSYTTEPKLTLTQHLLKNFGVSVNRADIVVAQNNQLQSQETFKNTVMEILTRTAVAYHDCILQQKNYEISRLSLERAQDLFEANTIRYEKGIVSSVDLLETEAAVASRKKTLLLGEASVKKADDELKFVTNLVDDPRIWNADVELTDGIRFKPRSVNLIASLEEAFMFRPDYQAAMIDLKNRDIKIQVAKNSLLPTVDLIGSFGLNGLGKEYQDAVKNVNSEYSDWSVGLKFILPWGGGERAKYDQTKLEKAQALIAFKRLEQSILLDVRDKVRETKVQFRQVKAARIAQEKETQNYQAQKERYVAGYISTHDLLDYQDALAQAETGYVKALIDYAVSLINLDKAKGTTLVKYNVILEEKYGRKP